MSADLPEKYSSFNGDKDTLETMRIQYNTDLKSLGLRLYGFDSRRPHQKQLEYHPGPGRLRPPVHRSPHSLKGR
ncbi:hypothetical protein EMEDMD4_160035 [Sinorhizobium medicae]|uniref:Uncharacterized protein n=1 Tax=Sinorhizobium medicae TaxID=110321 RepID=A0A508WSY3_9HYPH|nr:hypothetical protein EMEDMD4_160035 [Sinorhizobium medicae]